MHGSNNIDMNLAIDQQMYYVRANLIYALFFNNTHAMWNSLLPIGSS